MLLPLKSMCILKRNVPWAGLVDYTVHTDSYCLLTHRIIPLGIAIYIVAGVLIMKYHYNATGTDIIPNKAFWTKFPLLIKVKHN